MNTKAKIEQILKDSNTAEARSHALLQTLIVAFSKWENKRINKRAIDNVKAVIHAIGGQVNYNHSNFGDGTLQIWGIPGHPDYNNRTSYYLPSGEYTTEGLLKRNRWAGEAAVERMARREALLNAPAGTWSSPGAIATAALAINRFNQAKRDLDAALELLSDDKSQITKQLID